VHASLITIACPGTAGTAEAVEAVIRPNREVPGLELISRACRGAEEVQMIAGAGRDSVVQMAARADREEAGRRGATRHLERARDRPRALRRRDVAATSGRNDAPPLLLGRIEQLRQNALLVPVVVPPQRTRVLVHEIGDLLHPVGLPLDLTVVVVERRRRTVLLQAEDLGAIAPIVEAQENSLRQVKRHFFGTDNPS
jgi:hypothetical protein